MKFQNTFCSQCGGEFGPGDHGYSHCHDHQKKNTMYTVKILSEKNITSEHQIEAPSAQDAIDIVVDEAPFVISEVWCDNIHDYL
jgi:hypothetical protein